MVKRITMLFGAVFVVVGVFGFMVPGGMQMGDPAKPEDAALFKERSPNTYLDNMPWSRPAS